MYLLLYDVAVQRNKNEAKTKQKKENGKLKTSLG